MLYSLIYFLWRPDVPVSCCKVKCVDQDDSTDHEKRVCVVAMAFNIPVSCVYIYSCRNVLEVHKYFPVRVEQTLHLFCKLFLSKTPYGVFGDWCLFK